MARPAIQITDEIITKAERLAAQGLTQEQIARCLGWNPATLYEKKKQFSEFSESIKKGQAKGLAEITNALFESAKGGNVTAQIFFLKNRDPESWRDKQAVEHSGQARIAYEVIIDNAGRLIKNPIEICGEFEG